MAWFKDFDRLTPFIAAFKPMLQRELNNHVEDVYQQMIRNWEKGQDVSGQPWAPNAPSTLERKRGSTPLIETRQMIDSAGYDVDRDNLQAQIYIDDEEGKVLAHEYGVPEQNIPARPILGPVRDTLGQESDGMLKKSFDRSWASSKVSGVSVASGFRLGGGR